jgi:hypothetical protein
MRLTKFLLIVGGAGALTAWLVAAGTPRPAQTPGSAPLPARAAAGAPDAELAIETARLRSAMAAMPERLEARRDLFRYAGQRRAGAAAPQEDADYVPAGAPEASEAVAAASTRPELKLLGIAEDVAPDGAAVRTAILSTPQQLHMVREGEQVALRFLVQRITSDGVELKDLADDTLVQLQWR